MPRRDGGLLRVVVGALRRVALEHASLREALHRIARLRYGGPKRARELIGGLRGMRRIPDVAREKPRLSPRRLDRTVPAEAPVESRDRERKQEEQEAEEGEDGTRIERAHRGHDAVAAETTGPVVLIQEVVGMVRAAIGVVRIGTRVAARGTIA